MKNYKANLTTATSQSGFTLIELLLVISIIAVLSTLAVGVIGSAQNDSRVAATRARILSIEKMFEVELEDYEVRRSPIRIQTLAALTAQVIADNGLDSSRFLIHLKNLKRLVTADLIRTEMPNGRAARPVFGRFPSPELQAYLELELNVPIVPDTSIPPRVSIRALSQAVSANTLRWNGWQLNPNMDPPMPNNATRTIEQKLTDSSEMLYRIISELEFDGTSGLDSLGSSAVGDTDGDGQPEIVDAWGEPIAFQFQQQHLFQLPSDPTDPTQKDKENGVWREGGTFTDFEIESGVPIQRAAMPVQPSQIRLFLRSEKLAEVDGEQQDFTPLVLLN